MYIDLVNQILKETNNGLDIITDLIPDLDDAVINHKKAFRLRTDDRTPSAHLYPPKDGDDSWHVKDYGMGESGGYFSAVDLYMWFRGYSQDKFRIALEELAERYGVEKSLSHTTNKPVIEKRDARPDEIGAAPRVTLKPGLDGIDLSCWGGRVKAEHLTTYGWMAVSEVAITSGDKVIMRKPTPTYPIFAQKCDYVDNQGLTQHFYKVYEPYNPDKAYRFMIAGKKPQQNYIYGLQAVRKLFHEQGDEKLPVLLLVSGGSDAVCALSYGYLAVWLDSETKGLSDADYSMLMKHTHRLVNIPDIDSTGITAGRRLARNILSIHTAWLSDGDMGGLHDNRGRRCKDLRDYCRLNPSQQAMERLIARAISAKFWTTSTNNMGRKEYVLSRTSLDYFLELYGFYTLKDETRKEPVYIHIEGIVVEHVTAKRIVGFLKQWMTQQGLPKALQDKVLRSRDLPTNNVSTLRERDDLDFSRATATTQRFYFRNCWVEVSAERITTHNYTESDGHYVWKDSIIPHDYRTMNDQFTVTTDEDGQYIVTLSEDEKDLSNLLKFMVNSSRLYWRKTDEYGEPLTPEEQLDQHRCLASRLANLGYQLHSHKSESEAWATICMDSTMAESVDQCNGRSGKSFYVNAISKTAKTFTIDAGTTSFKDPRFLFDGVTNDTSRVFIDECPKTFDYNFIYGMVTGDFRVEEKNHHAYVIPFAESPKFVLATNFTLQRHDPSTEGRIWPQPFSDYYHVKTPQNDYRETRTIRDDFGKNLMGSEYSEHEWQLDYACMIQCVRFFLSLKPGERRIMPPMSRIERREQMAAVGKDFHQWADDYFAPDSGNLDCDLKAEQVLNDFNAETKFGWSPKKMTQHLNDYCKLADHIQCLNPATVTHKQKDGERWVKRDSNGQQKSYYYVQSVTTAEEAIGTEPIQANLQFEADPTSAMSSDQPF